MGFDACPDRPITQLVVLALAGRVRPRNARRGPYVPAIAGTAVITSERDSAAIALSTQLLRGILLGDSLEVLADRLDPDVVVWSPAGHAFSRRATLVDLATVDSPANALSELSLVTTEIGVVSPNIYIEWRLSGRFTSACLVDDDLMLEPTGRLVEFAGILVTTMTDGRVVSARCYYDDLALLEQLIVEPLRF